MSSWHSGPFTERRQLPHALRARGHRRDLTRLRSMAEDPRLRFWTEPGKFALLPSLGELLEASQE
jgi:hypothetical protein